MAKTPLSSGEAYATPDDLLDAHDENAVADLLSDEGPRPAGVRKSARVLKALRRASGMVEAACLTARKYEPEDLAALTGVGKDFLAGLVAELAFWLLQQRRQPNIEKTEAAKDALEMLERLRLGERIFGFEETADAGLPATSFVEQDDIDRLKLSTTLARRYYGRRAKEERLGR